MLGPVRFVITIIWFAIGLGIVGSLKDCTDIMGNKAAQAHMHGGISYGWWNRQLIGSKPPKTIPVKPYENQNKAEE